MYAYILNICKHVHKIMHTYSLKFHTEVSALAFVSLFDTGSGCVAQTPLELRAVLLSQPLECLDYGHEPSHLVSVLTSPVL